MRYLFGILQKFERTNASQFSPLFLYLSSWAVIPLPDQDFALGAENGGVVVFDVWGATDVLGRMELGTARKRHQRRSRIAERLTNGRNRGGATKAVVRVNAEQDEVLHWVERGGSGGGSSRGGGCCALRLLRLLVVPE
jgi:hypothetical protein